MATISLPPIEILDTAAARLIGQATPAEQRAINKALWNLQSGVEIRSTCGGFLMASGTRAGVVHRLDNVTGCSCESSGVCWHLKALAIIEEAQRYTMPALPLGDRLAKARKEMAELF